MKDSYVEKVQAFHCKQELTVSNVPQIPSDQCIDKQIRHMHTALAELCFAMKEDKMVNIARSLANLLYATFGTAIAYGIPIEFVFGEVHSSNMGQGTPQIRELLKRHNWNP